MVEKLKVKIEKEFDQAEDVIWLIDHGRLYDLETMKPQLIMSTKMNKDERQAENKKTSIICTEDMQVWKEVRKPSEKIQ